MTNIYIVVRRGSDPSGFKVINSDYECEDEDFFRPEQEAVVLREKNIPLEIPKRDSSDLPKGSSSDRKKRFWDELFNTRDPSHLDPCFTWSDSPQGHKYWRARNNGTEPVSGEDWAWLGRQYFLKFGKWPVNGPVAVVVLTKDPDSFIAASAIEADAIGIAADRYDVISVEFEI